MPTTRNGDVSLYYETFGADNDPVLLLVNGLGSQCINFKDAFCERFAARGFRVVRFDNRDVGLSSHLKGGPKYTVDDMADDGFAVLDAVGAPAAHIAGWDRAWQERFLLGLGVSHQVLIDLNEAGRYAKPYTRMYEYLDGLDAAHEPVPVDRRVLAALGPRMLELSRDVQSVAGARRAAPGGKLRITTSTSFAAAYLTDVVTDFLSRHPQTQVELIALERTVNLVEERIDLAVRIGNVLDDPLVARKLGVCRSVVCASPAYIKTSGTPSVPDDLRNHDCITHAYVGRTEFRLQRNGQSLRIPVRGQLQSNEAAVTRRAALAGAGIAMLPTYFVSADLASGELIRLLPDCEPEPLGIHAVYLSRQHQPQLLRMMVDFLADRLRGEVAPWDRVIASATKQATSIAKSRGSANGMVRRRPKAS